MHPDMHPCAHPGCHRRALRHRATCGTHAGLHDDLPAPLAAWPDTAPQADWLAPLGAFDLVLAQRDSLHRYLRRRPGYSPPSLAGELRQLRALSLTAADLAPATDGASARDEIDAFLDTLAERVLDEAAQEASP